MRNNLLQSRTASLMNREYVKIVHHQLHINLDIHHDYWVSDSLDIKSLNIHYLNHLHILLDEISFLIHKYLDINSKILYSIQIVCI
ncbi:unnamed protein product [Schistosoma mattheei]|uniref:Uncharacterized protein n=1 Tax=Schistosoma mattheei TaxID=31246 RepID=A0A183NS12_9TREM|nr:unnamed protein product [Schistosoma mattheei]